MSRAYDIDQEVLEVIVRSPGSMLDDIALQCPDLTWNQIFMAIDRLSREGLLKLTTTGRGLYKVHLSCHAPDSTSPHQYLSH